MVKNSLADHNLLYFQSAETESHLLLQSVEYVRSRMEALGITEPIMVQMSLLSTPINYEAFSQMLPTPTSPQQTSLKSTMKMAVLHQPVQQLRFFKLDKIMVK